MYSIRKLFLLVFLYQGLEQVICKRCNSEEVDGPLSVLINYESSNFPFYGEDEEQLDKTCLKINSSFTSMIEYMNRCQGDPDCDAECHAVIKIVQHTGLLPLTDELCSMDEPFRKLYLEYAHCLQSTENRYIQCHNISQTSKEFLMSNPEADMDMKCCYMSWYKSCLVEATLDNCGLNASFVISTALHHFIGKFEAKCGSKPPCLEPPLPEDEVPEHKKSIIDDSSAKGQSEKVSSDTSGVMRTYVINNNVIILLLFSIVSYIIIW